MPTPDSFQPAFHQPLPGSTRVEQRTTYRFRLPVARAGGRLRFVFRAGEGPLRVYQATVARAEAGGALASAPVAMSFLGAPGGSAEARGELRSDPLSFPVEFRDELAVSFEVDGVVASGGQALFPQGNVAPGSFAQARAGFGQPQAALVGLSTIEVEADPGPCVAVVGGGARAGSDLGDMRETWPAVAERLLGVPVLDLGDDLDGTDTQVDSQLLSRCARVDCVVLPEGDAVAGHSVDSLQAYLSAVFDRLRPLCQVYAGTLPPDASDPATRGAVNDWLRSKVPAERLIDFAKEAPEASDPQQPAWMGSAVVQRLRGPPISEQAKGLALEVTYRDTEHEVLAMDPSGTLYAMKVGDDHERLWASTDNARTWKVRGTHPGGYDFFKMTSLRDGTLLANVLGKGGNYALSRSTDHGVTWQVVLPLGQFRMLQPHNIREMHGTVFFLEYQTFSLASPINLWVSTDKGATWRVRYVFQGRRHGHSLVADPAQGVLWAMMGDLYGGLLRSVDDGVTWRPVLDGPPGVAVDGVITSGGLLFGTDNLFQPPLPAIKRVGREDKVSSLAGLPGPSYSIFKLPGGGYVLGTTRETSGDVYAPGDLSAHVLYSEDGVGWKEFRSFPRLAADDYARADVYWQLPSGELVLELSNTQELGSPRGFLLLKAVRK